MLIPLRKLFLSGYGQFRKLNRVEIEQKIYLYVPNRSASVAYEGGASPQAPLCVPSQRGGSINITILPFITLQSFVWSSIALIIHVSHFENWIFLFMVSLQKWLAHFFFSETNGEMKVSNVHQTCHSINWNYMYSI